MSSGITGRSGYLHIITHHLFEQNSYIGANRQQQKGTCPIWMSSRVPVVKLTGLWTLLLHLWSVAKSCNKKIKRTTPILACNLKLYRFPTLTSWHQSDQSDLLGLRRNQQQDQQWDWQTSGGASSIPRTLWTKTGLMSFRTTRVILPGMRRDQWGGPTGEPTAGPVGGLATLQGLCQQNWVNVLQNYQSDLPWLRRDQHDRGAVTSSTCTPQSQLQTRNFSITWLWEHITWPYTWLITWPLRHSYITWLISMRPWEPTTLWPWEDNTWPIKELVINNVTWPDALPTCV